MSLINLLQDSGTYNLGSGIGYSINQGRGIVESISGRELKTIYRSGRGIDVRGVVLGNFLLKARLDWQPAVLLEDGVVCT